MLISRWKRLGVATTTMSMSFRATRCRQSCTVSHPYWEPICSARWRKAGPKSEIATSRRSGMALTAAASRCPTAPQPMIATLRGRPSRRVFGSAVMLTTRSPLPGF